MNLKSKMMITVNLVSINSLIKVLQNITNKDINTHNDKEKEYKDKLSY